VLGRWTIGTGIDLTARLGGKGAGIFRMQQLGLPVPPAFVIGVSACSRYRRRGRDFLVNDLLPEVKQRMSELETASNKRFGDPAHPLLVSVRSGAPVSMPGMMDTVLNVGINAAVRKGIETATGKPSFAWDCHRRLLEMLGETVLGISKSRFAALRGDSGGDDWQRVVLRYEEEITRVASHSAYPLVVTDVEQQLLACVEAVLESWNNERAIRYRKMFKIPDDLGTAVCVQSMVFGNLDQNSGTGVVFTRDPSSGTHELTGEYLVGYQGEEVVAGEAERISKPIFMLGHEFPAIYRELAMIGHFLEFVARDVQDIEFTFERGKLYILQSRSAKCTPLASIRFLSEAVREGLMSQESALERAALIPRSALEAFLSQEVVKQDDASWIFARGRGVTPRAARGQLVLSPAEAVAQAAQGHHVVMARQMTSPDDIAGIETAVAIFTARGGPLSHAAIICRDMGKPCVVGTGARIDLQSGTVVGEDERVMRRGDIVTVDGSSGLIWGGDTKIETRELDLDLVGWLQRILNRSLV
jgi:pyruvate,orthophosphate dikinase